MASEQHAADPFSVRLRRMGSDVLRLVRWADWADTKLPLFLVGLCYALLRKEDLGIADAGRTLLLLVIIIFYAVFGHIVNDYADRDADRRAGKKKIMADWSEPVAVAAVVVPAAFMIAIAWAAFDAPTLAVSVISLLVAAFYSLPPIRWKERGVSGWIAATAAQRTLPLAIILQALDAWDIVSIGLAIMVTLVGVRFIIVHQLEDFYNDRKSGVRTAAVEQGVKRLSRWIDATFLAEALFALAVIVGMSVFEPVLAAVTLVCAAGYAVSAWHGHTLRQLTLEAFTCFYAAVWPMTLAILLAVKEPAFLPLVLAAAGLAQRIVRRRFRNAFFAPKLREIEPEGAFERGLAHISGGRWKEAQAELRVALKDKPNDFDRLIHYGKCLFQLRDFDAARAMFQKALSLRPRSSQAINGLGAVHQITGEVTQAIACLETALAIDPDYRPAYINLAVALRDAGRPAEALAVLERGLKRWPDFANAAKLRTEMQAGM